MSHDIQFNHWRMCKKETKDIGYLNCIYISTCKECGYDFGECIVCKSIVYTGQCGHCRIRPGEFHCCHALAFYADCGDPIYRTIPSNTIPKRH